MKKALVCLIAIAMVFSLTVPALAVSADPVITAVYNKGAKSVTINVGNVTETFTGITNNTTMPFIVNGWAVNVTAKNDVATINSIKNLSSAIPDNGDPVITAIYNKNVKSVTIYVDGVTETFTGITNNTTMTFIVNGWEINVTAKNDVATINFKKKV